ncbi:MAG: TRAP transporter large permease subunit [Chloroflexota bacterium]|nr:TRAP transporter large permease subunit [Chloroflexota bacterium]
MSPELMALILIGGLVVFLALGVEIAVSMGILASLGFILFSHDPQVQIPWTAWATLNSFVLLSMPLFIFMGTMFANTGVVRSLFNAADKWIGILPGGLASSVVVANAVFGAMCGSSIAAAATFSAIAFPEMEKKGYDPKLALGVICVGGTLSVLIPPSLILIVYGAWEEQSVAKLFAAAMIPGIILATLLVITVMIMALMNRSLTPQVAHYTWRERFIAIRDILPWAGVIALVLGVIFGGVMTPTESSALGAFLSLVMSAAYRQMSYKALKNSLFTTVKVTAMIGFIIFTARLLSFVFQASGLTQSFAHIMSGLALGKYGVFTVIVILYLVLGCFLDTFSMMLLTFPFVMPLLTSLGFSPIWWGVTFVILAEIGVVTPPFGLNLFAIHGVLPRYSVMTIAGASMPFLIPLLVMIAIMVAFPDLALWLPGVLYG